MSFAPGFGNRIFGDMYDLRYAFRMLIKYRAATIFAVLALGIGIGANSTIFSMANSLLLSPWPFSSPDRIMRIGEKRVGQAIGNLSLAGPNYLEWKDRCQSFEATCLMTVKYFNLTGDAGRPEEVAAYFWSPTGNDVFQSTQPMLLECRPKTCHIPVLLDDVIEGRSGNLKSLR